MKDSIEHISPEQDLTIVWTAIPIYLFYNLLLNVYHIRRHLMKQQLGIQYSENNPISYILSNRLVQLQKAFSGIELAASIQRSKSRRYMKTIDRHVINLMETYGQNAVLNIYEEIFVIKSNKKVS